MNDGTASGGGGPSERPVDVAGFADRYSVWVTVTIQTLEELLRTFDLDVGDRPLVEAVSEGTGRLIAFASREQIDQLQTAGYEVEVGENVSDLGRRRQAEIGQGDRFAGSRATPEGLAVKTREDRRRGPRP